MERHSTPRTFHIDLAGKDAALQLQAIRLWPHDQKAREDFLITSVASAMRTIKPELRRRTEEMLRERVQLPADALEGYLETAADPIAAAINAEIAECYYEPHGGRDALLEAPPPKDIFRSAEIEGGKYGAASGEILGYIVMMNQHHRPELSPSARLATHIMVQRAKFENRSIPDDHDRKKMWGQWGGVAHLWAARALAKATPGVPVKLILQHAHWLADFAIKFRSHKARMPLLTEAEVVRVNPDLPPLEPPIPPLSDQLLGWARSYGK